MNSPDCLFFMEFTGDHAIIEDTPHICLAIINLSLVSCKTIPPYISAFLISVFIIIRDFFIPVVGHGLAGTIVCDGF